MRILFFIFFTSLVAACNQAQEPVAESRADAWFVNSAGDTIQRIFKSEAEWKEQLDQMAYYVLREAGTERAFTGDLLDNKQKGVYTCAGCGLPLFSSAHKFNSGSGWPSYYQPIDPAHIEEKPDHSFGWNRVELLCARCGGHLGHVFDDGPKPTGLRYCINSVSLDFEEQ